MPTHGVGCRTASLENYDGSVTNSTLNGYLAQLNRGAAIVLEHRFFGQSNPSGRLPVSFPTSVGTTPAFYNYLKGSRPLDPGHITDNGTLLFGHQYVLDTPVPLWSFGDGLSYTTFQ